MVNLLYYTRRVPQNRKMARDGVGATSPRPQTGCITAGARTPRPQTYVQARPYIHCHPATSTQATISLPTSHPLHPHQANQAIHVATPTKLKRSSFLQHPAELQARSSCHIRSLFSSAFQKSPSYRQIRHLPKTIPRILRPVKASHGSVIQYISK